MDGSSDIAIRTWRIPCTICCCSAARAWPSWPHGSVLRLRASAAGRSHCAPGWRSGAVLQRPPARISGITYSPVRWSDLRDTPGEGRPGAPRHVSHRALRRQKQRRVDIVPDRSVHSNSHAARHERHPRLVAAQCRLQQYSVTIVMRPGVPRGLFAARQFASVPSADHYGGRAMSSTQTRC